MKWFDMSDDERKEWRDDPRTKAFFETIRKRIEETSGDVVSAMGDKGDDAERRARWLAGSVNGLKLTIDIMESDS